MAMNLKDCGGKVPIYLDGDIPIILVAFPDRETFDALYPKQTRPGSRDRYWVILNLLRQGKSLAEAGRGHGITKEGVRQIEAKFLRLMRESYLKSKTV